MINPFLPIRNMRYWNMDKLCDVTVYVGNNSKRAVIIKNKAYQRVSIHFLWRNLNNIFTSIVTIYILLFSSQSNETNIILSSIWVLIHYWIY